MIDWLENSTLKNVNVNKKIMIETLNSIGIDTKQLNSKPIHSRLETLNLLQCSNPTLNKYKRKGWLQQSKFKNQIFYSSESILRCLKRQLNFNDKISDEWDSLWD